MNRKNFLKLAGNLGIGLPFSGISLTSKHRKVLPSNFTGKVLIIGAGAAGLAAGYLLNQLNIEFQILEAQSTYGGRMIRTLDFADFPIPLGAEWLHVTPHVFADIVNDDSQPVDLSLVNYPPNCSYGVWENGVLTVDNIGSFNDQKFQRSSWFDFFEEYIYPSVAPHITYNSIVRAIDYSNDSIVVTSDDGRKFISDKIIVTLPLKVIQEEDVTFFPVLPDSKSHAIRQAHVWDGIKVFIKFSQSFYPTFLEIRNFVPKTGELLYYDAAYGQNSDQHILGLFSVGAPSQTYISLTGDALHDYILEELDGIFSNQASPNYQGHIVQNWSQAPFFKGAYLQDFEEEEIVRILGEPVGNKVFFAGEAYTDGKDWGGLHAAIQSAKVAVEALCS